MHSYRITQWVLFFFLYAFFGWIWECFYVAAEGAYRNKKWKFVNRGFLHGPIIPIYGFAAISILVVTIPLSENTYAVFLIGALTATLFELITGTAMESLFKVKYWDYSNLPLNYHGHICFFVSLFWGFFSVLLVQIVHVPVDRFLMRIPMLLCEILSFLLIVVFTYDVTISFNEAMELRDILESLLENSETIKRIERRFDAIVAFATAPEDELPNIRLTVKEKVTYRVERLRSRNEQRINRIKEYIMLPEFDELSDRKELLEKLEFHRKRIMEKSNKQFIHATNQLKRNPNAKSKKYQEMIKLLNDWIND